MPIKEGIVCQVCGVECPTRFTTFHQNIGMLLMRRYKTLKCYMCKSCMNSKFWSMTGTTLAVGWLGTISLIVAPIFVISNTAVYLSRLGMPGKPADATVPQLNDFVIETLQPYMAEITRRVNGGEALHAVCRDIAPKADVTPGQVLNYVIAVINSQRAQTQPPPKGGRGFEVMPPPKE